MNNESVRFSCLASNLKVGKTCLSCEHTQSGGVITECCDSLLSSGCLCPSAGWKACTGHILFKQIKRSMSSCPHQSLRCLPDGPTRNPLSSFFSSPITHPSHFTRCAAFILPLIFIFVAVSL